MTFNNQNNFDKANRFLIALRHCQVLGMTVQEAGDNTLVMVLPPNDTHVGNSTHGFIHSGAVTTLMDSACGTVVFMTLDGCELCPTLDLRVDHMRPAPAGSTLYGCARVTRISDSVVFADCDVYMNEQCDADSLIARCRASFMRIGAEKSRSEFIDATDQHGHGGTA